MRAWRIYNHNRQWARRPDFNPLAGEGALYAAGRWHQEGTPMLYASTSPSLALLETLVHIPMADFGEQTLLELEVPGNPETVSHAKLIQLFRDAPAGVPEGATRAFGTFWASEQRSLSFLTPSIVMPHENNVILNPRHPDMKQVRIVSSETITLDARLFGSA